MPRRIPEADRKPCPGPCRFLPTLLLRRPNAVHRSPQPDSRGTRPGMTRRATSSPTYLTTCCWMAPEDRPAGPPIARCAAMVQCTRGDDGNRWPAICNLFWPAQICATLCCVESPLATSCRSAWRRANGVSTTIALDRSREAAAGNLPQLPYLRVASFMMLSCRLSWITRTRLEGTS